MTEDEMVGWHHQINSGSWWWTGRPGVLPSMGSQSVRHNWATELNWSPAREGKHQWRVCLHPHLEQGRTLLVKKKSMAVDAAHFFSYQCEPAVPEPSLKCILKNQDKFAPQSLKKTCLIFFCNTEWPRYPLEDRERDLLKDFNYYCFTSRPVL